jgi:hypothetical protein
MKRKIQEGKFVAIDIGSTSVKASILETSASSTRLLSIEEVSYDTPIIHKDDEGSKESLIKALKELNTKLSMSKVANITSLFSHRELQVKILDLPAQIELTDLEKTLAWEAKKLLSSSHKDAPCTFSYKIIRSNPLSVALAVIPTSILEKHIELFKLAGIKLSGIIPEVYANTSLLQMADITGLPAVSIVNIGHSGTHLQIYSAGELKFYRYIPSGMNEMSSPPTNTELEVYTQKIRFSFDYFRAITKLTQVDLLSFLGGGASCDTLLPYAQGYFAPTRITSLDISSMIDITNALSDSNEQGMDAKEKQKRLLPFIPSIGSSLVMSSAEAKTINLLFRLKETKKLESKLALISNTPHYIFIAVIIIAFLVSSLYSNHLRKYQARLTGEINEIQANLDELKEKELVFKDEAGNPLKILQFSGKTTDVLNPLLEQPASHVSLANSIIIAKKYNLFIEEILIKGEEEAESMRLAERNTSNSTEDSEDEINKYLSSMAQVELNEQELSSQILGDILIIKGYARNEFNLADFTRDLVHGQNKGYRPLTRIKSLQSRKGSNGVEFLLKGVLP